MMEPIGLYCGTFNPCTTGLLVGRYPARAVLIMSRADHSAHFLVEGLRFDAHGVNLLLFVDIGAFASSDSPAGDTHPNWTRGSSFLSSGLIPLSGEPPQMRRMSSSPGAFLSQGAAFACTAACTDFASPRMIGMSSS